MSLASADIHFNLSRAEQCEAARLTREIRKQKLRNNTYHSISDCYWTAARQISERRTPVRGAEEEIAPDAEPCPECNDTGLVRCSCPYGDAYL